MFKRIVSIKLEVQKDEQGWRLYAIPCNGGWTPIALTDHRGTANGAVVEFANMMYALRLKV